MQRRRARLGSSKGEALPAFKSLQLFLNKNEKVWRTALYSLAIQLRGHLVVEIRLLQGLIGKDKAHWY